MTRDGRPCLPTHHPRFHREQFAGWIAGPGTDSGNRLVIGHWHTSPYGVVTDVMASLQVLGLPSGR
jgi:hypothetical protein